MSTTTKTRRISTRSTTRNSARATRCVGRRREAGRSVLSAYDYTDPIELSELLEAGRTISPHTDTVTLLS